MIRKRPRTEASGILQACVKPDHDRGEPSDLAAEQSTSSSCQTESERNTWLSYTNLKVDTAWSHTAKGPQYQQPREEKQLDRWPLIDSLMEANRLTANLLTQATDVLKNGQHMHQNEKNRMSSCQSSSTTAPSSETSVHHESEIETESLKATTPKTTPFLAVVPKESRDASLPSSSLPKLPKLQPTAPDRCVVPNCCDYFTSPHPHYPKEVVGRAPKVDESFQTNPLPTDLAESKETTETTTTNSFKDSTEEATSSRGNQEKDDFEMWDYVCPQYARRGYANEWV
ncbi:hypothetical protein CCR75_001168 [Bremia lactucae]|uniref:Uncharacterized protein n=1 Tax=Bremia lactucae TaxID=4779 RepID=A0A976FQH4_BRELC|nr:hypothetical protein CCR75_001168 [Bremia lactucae]